MLINCSIRMLIITGKLMSHICLYVYFIAQLKIARYSILHS